MYELYIEGYKVDIDQKLSIALTYAIDDVSNFSSRETAFSKTIIIPGTAYNNKIFGFIYDLGSFNYEAPGAVNIGAVFNVAQTSRAELRLNGLLVLKGVFRITNIIKDGDVIEYEGAIFGELSGFIAQIGNSKLEDLDFEEYNHNYTRDNIVNSWNTVNGKGYYYPLIDYGTYSTPQTNGNRVKIDYDYRTFRPALYLKEYIDKIFTNSGYTYISNFFNSDFFKKLIIPCNFSKLTKTVTALLEGKRVTQFIIPDSRTIIRQYYLDYPVTVLNNFSGTGNPNFIYVGLQTDIEITFNIRGFVNFWNLDGQLIISLEKNGSPIFERSYVPINSFTTAFNESVKLNININTNDTIRVFVGAINTYNPNNVRPTAIDFTSLSIKAINPIAADIILNDQIDINKILPRNILQKDFFTWIVKMFNLYIVEKPNEVVSIDKITYLSLLINTNQNIPNNISGNDETSPINWNQLVLNEFTLFGGSTYQYNGANQRLTLQGTIRATYYTKAFAFPDNINEYVFYLRIKRTRNSVTTIIAETQVITPPDQTINIDLSLNVTEDIRNGDRYTLAYGYPPNKQNTPTSFITYSSFQVFKNSIEKTENILYIEPYIDFYNNNIIDWTYKIARDKSWQINPMGMLNGRFFEYIYKEDNDHYNEKYKKKYNLPYGSRLEDTGFQFAKDKQTVEIGFSPTVLIQYKATDKILPAIYKKSEGKAVDQEELIDSNIRILMAKRMTGVNSWYIVNNGLVQNTTPQQLGSALTTYGYAGHFDDPKNPTKDLNFGACEEIYFEPTIYTTNNLFNDYWSEYIAEIADKDSKILTCYVHLTALDIAQLDFSRPIRIDNVLFRINKIIDYDYVNDELVKVELLKIINNG